MKERKKQKGKYVEHTCREKVGKGSNEELKYLEKQGQLWTK